jgi:hypothetical protein
MQTKDDINSAITTGLDYHNWFVERCHQLFDECTKIEHKKQGMHDFEERRAMQFTKMFFISEVLLHVETYLPDLWRNSPKDYDLLLYSTLEKIRDLKGDMRFPYNVPTTVEEHEIHTCLMKTMNSCEHVLMGLELSDWR